MTKKSIFQKFPILQTISLGKFPKHICIIPDGNGRFAKAHGKFVTEGHKKGFSVAYDILDAMSEIKQIEAVTIWGFSTDNWKRSKKEIAGLMRIFSFVIKKTVKDLQKRNGRFIHIGRKDRIPNTLVQVLEQAEKQTQANTGQKVCLAIDFGGQDQEIRELQKAVLLNKNTIIDEKILWQLRDGHGLIGSADLLIRTSGEKRISDIGWINGAQTELVFIPKLFPEITVLDIVEAIVEFSKRDRRLGARLT